MRMFQHTVIELRIVSNPVAKDVSHDGADHTRVSFLSEHDDSTERRAHVSKIEVEAWDAIADQLLRQARKGDTAMLMGQFRDRATGNQASRWVFVCTGIHRCQTTHQEARSGGNRQSLSTKDNKTRIDVSDQGSLDA